MKILAQNIPPIIPTFLQRGMCFANTWNMVGGGKGFSLSVKEEKNEKKKKKKDFACYRWKLKRGFCYRPTLTRFVLQCMIFKLVKVRAKSIHSIKSKSIAPHQNSLPDDEWWMIDEIERFVDRFVASNCRSFRFQCFHFKIFVLGFVLFCKAVAGALDGWVFSKGRVFGFEELYEHIRTFIHEYRRSRRKEGKKKEKRTGQDWTEGKEGPPFFN